MKIRTGFVSNSSSSSFTCNVCGEEYSGYDASLEDGEMWQCERGHTFCESHLVVEADDEISRIYLLGERSYIEDDEKAKIKALNAEELEEYLEYNEDCMYDMRYELPSCCCPICNFVSIDPEEATKYLMLKNSLTMDTLKAKIRDEFEDYDAFRAHINDKKE